LGKFWRVLEWKMLVGILYGHLEDFTAIWHTLCSCGNIVIIWCIFDCFGILSREKSGNPDRTYVCRYRHFSQFSESVFSFPLKTGKGKYEEWKTFFRCAFGQSWLHVQNLQKLRFWIHQTRRSWVHFPAKIAYW
jgi:hypothetical protein